MADFQTALLWVLTFEDGPPPFRYQSVIDNNGGGVIAGINSKSFPAQFAAIDSLPRNQRGPAVEDFYRTQFWSQVFDQIALDDAAKRIMDACVNMGKGTGVRIAQLAANTAVDGALGPNTVAAINAAGTGFIPAFQRARLAHYRSIVASNPADARYLGAEANPGPWMRRALA